MDLVDAITSRRSIRAFKPEPVPRRIVRELLVTAVRAPSGVNSQPWEFYLVSGNALDELREACTEKYRLGIEPKPDITIPSIGNVGPRLRGIYRDRSVRLAKQIFEAVGILKGDDERLREYYENMYHFFGAPAVLIIVHDKLLSGGWPLVDSGIMAQTIALMAQQYGLGTCIMRAIVDYPDTLREIVKIPDSKFIVIGMAIGKPDWDHPINNILSEREALENILTFVD
ncbi:MAG: nitroreductase [Deltaproteobacteria bacterium]|nr:nitroreductase [Deltaproteobacteria bacterium]